MPNVPGKSIKGVLVKYGPGSYSPPFQQVSYSSSSAGLPMSKKVRLADAGYTTADRYDAFRNRSEFVKPGPLSGVRRLRRSLG
jgi:hypothetical protein